jgi:hypothetical protein
VKWPNLNERNVKLPPPFILLKKIKIVQFGPAFKIVHTFLTQKQHAQVCYLKRPGLATFQISLFWKAAAEERRPEL